MNEKESDQDLIKKVQNGDVAAFEVLVRRYQQKVFSFVRRIVFEDAAAQDITQEVMFRIYTVVDRIDLSKKFSTFLFEVAKNKALDYKKAQKIHLPLEEAEYIDDDFSIYESLIEEEAADQIRLAIQTLPKKYSQVILLYYLNDLSYEEIAEKLGIPLNTVRTNLRRGKEALLEHLTHENH